MEHFFLFVSLHGYIYLRAHPPSKMKKITEWEKRENMGKGRQINRNKKILIYINIIIDSVEMYIKNMFQRL